MEITTSLNSPRCMYRRAWLLGLLVGLWLLPAEPWAKPALLHYRATWAGLPAAEIYLQLGDAGTDFDARIHIDTVGLPHLLSRFRADADAVGRLVPGHSAVPRLYDARYQLRKKRKRTVIRYVDADAKRLAERGTGDTSDHPELAERLRRDVLDPLSALVEIRDLIRQRKLLPGGKFVIPVYDGKRRLDVDGELMAADPEAAAPKALELRLLLRPIAGFRPDEQEDETVDDKPREVHLQLSDDGRLVPLRLSVSILYLPAVVSFVGECGPAAPCKAGMQ